MPVLQPTCKKRRSPPSPPSMPASMPVQKVMHLPVKMPGVPLVSDTGSVSLEIANVSRMEGLPLGGIR